MPHVAQLGGGGCLNQSVGLLVQAMHEHEVVCLRELLKMSAVGQGAWVRVLIIVAGVLGFGGRWRLLDLVVAAFGGDCGFGYDVQAREVEGALVAPDAPEDACEARGDGGGGPVFS